MNSTISGRLEPHKLPGPAVGQSGGKRLRPVLTLLTARATGATEVDAQWGIRGEFQGVPAMLLGL